MHFQLPKAKIKNMQPVLHQPIMVEEILSALDTLPIPFKKFLDGTFGRGGHTVRILNKFPEVKAIALDHDEEAIEYGKKNFEEFVSEGRLEIHRRKYSQGDEFKPCDAILLDLGVSSPQLDVGERGFSFYHDGPLDMRMDHRAETTAALVVNTFSESELIEIFKEYGEIHRSQRVVKAILAQRKIKPFERTSELANLIASTEGWRRKGFHPATMYFMGLRLYVNQELEVLSQGLPKLMECLNTDGFLIVITFHSLEDRIVKRIFKNSPLGRPVNKKVIVPARDEQKKNPRSRSAKLRIFQRQEVVDVQKNKYSHTEDN